jgi:hypothetical protein
MQNTLKAWVQDPDDWKIKHYIPKQRKPSIIKRISRWLMSLIETPIGFILFLILANSLGCWLAGPS